MPDRRFNTPPPSPPPPPPTSDDARPTKNPARSFRIAGFVLACSTPITGLIAYAFVAIVVGEQHLETSEGTTTAGWLTMSLPILAGACLVAWSFANPKAPRARTIAVLCAAASAVALGLGLFSIASASAASDASIGGALLVVMSVPLAIGAAAALWSARRDTRRPVSDGEP